MNAYAPIGFCPKVVILEGEEGKNWKDLIIRTKNILCTVQVYWTSFIAHFFRHCWSTDPLTLGGYSHPGPETSDNDHQVLMIMMMMMIQIMIMISIFMMITSCWFCWFVMISRCWWPLVRGRCGPGQGWILCRKTGSVHLCTQYICSLYRARLRCWVAI